MKKTTKLLVVVLCLVCVAGVLTLAACDKGATDNLTKTVTVVIGDDGPLVITVTTGAKYLFDVMNELAQREADPVALSGSWSAYGLFVTEVGAIKAEAPNEYIAVLTSDEGYRDITEFALERKHGERVLWSSSLGISSLPVKDGEVYMFVLATF